MPESRWGQNKTNRQKQHLLGQKKSSTFSPCPKNPYQLVFLLYSSLQFLHLSTPKKKSKLIKRPINDIYICPDYIRLNLTWWDWTNFIMTFSTVRWEWLLLFYTNKRVTIFVRLTPVSSLSLQYNLFCHVMYNTCDINTDLWFWRLRDRCQSTSMWRTW